MKKPSVLSIASLLFVSLSAFAEPRTDGPVYKSCKDLMLRIMDRYSRAPICHPMLNAKGDSLSEVTGFIGLTDDGRYDWMFLNIRADKWSDTYHFNPGEMDVVAGRVEHEGRGLTRKQQEYLGFKMAKDNVDRMHHDGKLTDAEYALSIKWFNDAEPNYLRDPEMALPTFPAKK